MRKEDIVESDLQLLAFWQWANCPHFWKTFVKTEKRCSFSRPFLIYLSLLVKSKFYILTMVLSDYSKNTRKHSFFCHDQIEVNTFLIKYWGNISSPLPFITRKLICLHRV